MVHILRIFNLCPILREKLFNSTICQLKLFVEKAFTVDRAKTRDVLRALLLHFGQPRFKVGHLVGRVDHASIKLLNALGFKEFDVLGDLLIKRAGQHVADFLDSPERQVMLNVHIGRIQLVSEILRSFVETIAHLLSFVDALQKALLTGCLGSQFHTRFLHGGDRFLRRCHPLTIILHCYIMFIESVFHLLHFVVETTNASLKQTDFFVH